MFVLGHVGIGRLIVGSRGRALPVAPFVLGAVLPDLIDKPLYYAHVWSYVSCTRTFGHTGVLLAAVAIVAWARKSPAWTAAALAMSTHLFFDWLLDLQSTSTSSTLVAMTWPFWWTRFWQYDVTPLEHLRMVVRLDILVTELIGLAVLVWEYRRRRRVSPGGPGR